MACPKVSVFVITYNQEHYVRETLDSIVAQDYPNMEIVVADDASTDGTPEILREYDRNHPGRFKLVLSERNGGITINSNRGFFACTGEYVNFMGGDDVMLPGKIRKQVAVLEADSKASVCVTAADVFDSETNKTLFIHPCTVNGLGEYGPREIVRVNNCVLGSTALARRAMCPPGGFDERIPVVSDFLFYVETSVRGPVKVLDEVLWRYRRHGNNTMTERYRDRIDSALTYAILEFKYPFLIPEINIARATYFYLRALEFFNRGDVDEARPLMQQAFRYGRSPKTLVWLGLMALPTNLRDNARRRWLRRIGLEAS